MGRLKGVFYRVHSSPLKLMLRLTEMESVQAAIKLTDCRALHVFLKEKKQHLAEESKAVVMPQTFVSSEVT